MWSWCKGNREYGCVLVSLCDAKNILVVILKHKMNYFCINVFGVLSTVVIALSLFQLAPLPGLLNRPYLGALQSIDSIRPPYLPEAPTYTSQPVQQTQLLLGGAGDWFCGNADMKKYGDWCTCPAGYAPTVLLGKHACVIQSFWKDLENALVETGAVVAALAACVGTRAVTASYVSAAAGPAAIYAEGAAIVGAGFTCVVELTLLPTAGAAIDISLTHENHIPMTIPDGYTACPWNHGPFGGQGLTLCDQGCGNLNTNGCKNGQYCSKGMQLAVGESCECGAFDVPYMCPESHPEWFDCSKVTRNFEIGGCNKADGVTCSDGTLVTWQSNNAGGLACRPLSFDFTLPVGSHCWSDYTYSPSCAHCKYGYGRPKGANVDYCCSEDDSPNCNSITPPPPPSPPPFPPYPPPPPSLPPPPSPPYPPPTPTGCIQDTYDPTSPSHDPNWYYCSQTKVSGTLSSDGKEVTNNLMKFRCCHEDPKKACSYQQWTLSSGDYGCYY